MTKSAAIDLGSRKIRVNSTRTKVEAMLRRTLGKPLVVSMLGSGAGRWRYALAGRRR
jgi:Arc/MetJ family transcription regulator